MPRIVNRPAQARQAEGLEEGTTPALSLPRAKLRAGPLDPEATEPVFDKPIDLDKLDCRVAGSEVPTPTRARQLGKTVAVVKRQRLNRFVNHTKAR